MEQILEIRNLSKSYGGINAVDNCSFGIERANITGLIGPNGAGKTTLFNLLSGFEKPDSGNVYFENNDITNLESYKIVEQGICRTFQITKLFPNLTCLENIMISKKIANDYVSILGEIFENDEKLAKYSFKFLELVGLAEKKNTLGKDLSYGQQKLLEIARSLATEPKLLLLDEPFAGVNPKMVETIKQKIIDIKNSGKTVFIIEHNISAVMELCNKIIVLDYGEKIAEGKPNEVRNNKTVIEAYLGAAHGKK